MKKTLRVDQFSVGECFVNELYSLPFAVKRDWLFRKHYEAWHPDSWVYDPSAYLKGVDEGDFGKASALKRWLYYFDQGLMETGYQRDNSHAEFISYFNKYK